MKHNYEFRRLYAKGKSASTSLIVIYCKRNRKGISQLGLTVGTKVGKATCRNRIRRKLKEIYRLNESEVKRGWDIIIVARVRARSATYDQLQADFLKLLDKLGLYAARQPSDLPVQKREGAI